MPSLAVSGIFPGNFLIIYKILAQIIEKAFFYNTVPFLPFIYIIVFDKRYIPQSSLL